MRRKWQYPTAAVATLAIVGLLVVAGASPPQPRLPGAGAVIAAAGYPTIQAAINALPESGGIDLRDAHGCAVSANAFTIMGKDALTIGPRSGRITVTANNFSDSYIGEGTTKRAADDRAAAGMVLEATKDITIVGNLFAGLRPKALTVKGKPSESVIFSANLLADTETDCDKLPKSLIDKNLASTE